MNKYSTPQMIKGRNNQTQKSTKRLTRLQNINSNHPGINPKQLITLQKTLEQSRIGVENITKFKKDEQYFSEQFSCIREELQDVIINITTQGKRNKVFKQLITLLKGEMKEIYQQEAQQIEKNEDQVNKQVKELKIYIDRISHKRNQQVANIKILKEQASSARRQRVIYSNLFKKMEKQIKQSQEIYKEQILSLEKINQELYFAKMDTIPDKPNDWILNKIPEQDLQFYQNQEFQDFTEACYPIKKCQSNIDKFSGDFREKNIRLSKTKTFYNPKSALLKQKKSSQQSSGHTNIRTLSNRETIQTNIVKHQRLCERAMTIAGFQSLIEMLSKFSNLSEKNEELYNDIGSLNQQIQLLSKQMSNKQRQNYVATFVEDTQELNKNENNTKIKKYQKDGSSLNLGVIEDICKLFNIDAKKTNQWQDFEIVQQTSRRIDSMIEVCWPHSPKQAANDNKQQTVNIDLLLNRMEGFGLCERLLDEKAFRNQYSREVQRRNQAKKYKKLD